MSEQNVDNQEQRSADVAAGPGGARSRPLPQVPPPPVRRSSVPKGVSAAGSGGPAAASPGMAAVRAARMPKSGQRSQQKQGLGAAFTQGAQRGAMNTAAANIAEAGQARASGEPEADQEAEAEPAAEEPSADDRVRLYNADLRSQQVDRLVESRHAQDVHSELLDNGYGVVNRESYQALESQQKALWEDVEHHQSSVDPEQLAEADARYEHDVVTEQTNPVRENVKSQLGPALATKLLPGNLAVHESMREAAAQRQQQQTQREVEDTLESPDSPKKAESGAKQRAEQDLEAKLESRGLAGPESIDAGREAGE